MTQQLQNPQNALLIIDSRINNWQSLLPNNNTIPVLLINNVSDGLVQITNAINTYHNLAAIYTISNDSEGGLLLGSTIKNLGTQPQALTAITQALNIFLYGSDIASDSVAFINQLTQADIAVSTNVTGVTARSLAFKASAQSSLVKQGTSAADKLNGTTAADSLYGLGGDDSLAGEAANDLLDAGVGDDALWGNAGNDTLLGGDGDDYLEGDDGNDSLDGGKGDDQLFAGVGNDNASGGEGHDYIDGGAGNDKLFGNGGDDTLVDTTGLNSIDGGSGNDQVFGGTGVDSLNGGDGNDSVDGGSGNDAVFGGAGDDNLWGQQGADTLSGGDGNDYLDSDGSGSDTSSNSLNGGGGNDQLFGGSGSDSVDGGSGKDTLSGGAGNDRYYVDNVNDLIQDNSGDDTVYVGVNGYRVPSDVEHVVYNAGVQALPYFINSLDSGSHWSDIGQAKSLSYSFVTNGVDNITPNIKGFMPYTETQKTAVRQALGIYSSLTGLTFSEKTDSTAIELRFFRDDLTSGGYSSSAGYTWYPTRGDVHIKNIYGDTELSKGQYGFELLLHEIGHGLGLKHPFESPVLITSEDNNSNTVMSYTHTSGSDATAPKLFDIAAIQYLYGVNTSYNAGNTTYHFSDRYIGDGSGIDTFSASEQSKSTTINLNAGSWNYISAKASSILSSGQSFIGYNTVIENATGGSGNDIITGNNAANSLIGGAGADTLIGGLGKDTINLSETSSSTDSVKINAGDSLVNSFDSVSGFKLSTDKLDLPNTFIKANINAVNGTDAGIIHSHHIVNGIISFDDSNTYTAPLAITSSNISAVMSYLQANITSAGNTVAFIGAGNTYVFQDGGSNDSLVQLTGVNASNLSINGAVAGAVWLV